MAHAPQVAWDCGILGNHDYGFNWRMMECAQRVTEIVRSFELHYSVIRRLSLWDTVYRIDDLWSPCFDPGEMLNEKSQARLYFGAVS